MRHVISLLDLSSDEIRCVLEKGRELKQKLERGERPSLMQNRVAGLIFEKPSLRTRVSFETLMAQMGGSSLFLGSDVGWGSREPICDFIPILTSYLDLLIIRAKSHTQVEEATKYSCCPIINGLTDLCHPCQALADIMTVIELEGDLNNTKIAYIGDGNNVAESLAVICSRLQIPICIGAPAHYQLPEKLVVQLNQAGGGQWISQTTDPKAAVQDASIVYTDVWTSMGQEAEREQRLVDLRGYQVDAGLMKQARANARFLHCLPARRDEEVSAEVIDGPSSAVFQQANNRLHAQKGLVVWLLNEANKNPTAGQ
jgi:ornithine carbamoyltransferase